MIEERENREKVIVAVEDEVTAEKEEVIVDAKEVIVIEEKEMTDLINGEDHLNPRRNQIRIRNNQGELLLKRNDQTQKEEIPVIHLKKMRNIKETRMEMAVMKIRIRKQKISKIKVIMRAFLQSTSKKPIMIMSNEINYLT